MENDLSVLHDKMGEFLSTRDELTKNQSGISVSMNRLGIEIEKKKKDIDAGEYEISIRHEAVEELLSKRNIEDNKISTANEKLEEIARKISGGKEASDRISSEIAEMQSEIAEISKQNLINEAKDSKLREETKELTHKRETLFREFTKLESQCESVQSEQDKLIAHLWDEHELTYSAACECEYEKITQGTRPDAVKARNELRGKIKNLGHVNVNAIEEYEEVKTRYDFLKTQFEDLNKSKNELSGVIYKLESEMRTQFIDVLEQINKNFKEVFRELFGGGTAELHLSDPENVLTSGIEINVAPPGKIIKNLVELSGGEQSFIAIAIYLSILKVKPAPFCILDEIEAALDEVNVQKYAQYLRKVSDKTQFIMITHRRGSMEEADRLYGVTMQEKGVSKLLQMNLSEVESKLGIKDED